MRWLFTTDDPELIDLNKTVVQETAVDGIDAGDMVLVEVIGTPWIILAQESELEPL